MLYHLSEYLTQHFDIPGMGMFKYISFRAAMAIIFALLIAIVFGIKIIRQLQKKQIGEEIRNLGLEGQLQKKGTPTMGGLIIILSILVPVLLFANLSNIYVQLMLLTTVWLGTIGFLDDYIKVFKKNKAGLRGRFKIIAQVGLGIIVGVTMWQSEQIVVREKMVDKKGVPTSYTYSENITSRMNIKLKPAEKSTKTTIPFFKNNEFDYADLFPGKAGQTWGWIIYVIAAILIITAVSNGANLTDGLDGLAGGVSAIVGVALAALAYLSGNIIYSDYLDIMYIPNSGELFIYGAAFVGALIGFLWYNNYPAQVFMGDTGSLAIGGIIAVFALLIRKEFLLPILCAVFLAESISVIVQVGYFKYTKRKYGEGRRIFLMSPLHHHYQKRGFFETKIVFRFWVVQLLCAAVALITLKIR